MTFAQKENCVKAEWTNRDSLSIDETTGYNSKAVLVIDTPKNCAECKLMYLQGIGESICNAVDWERRPSWCPLRTLPKPITEYEVKVSYAYDSDYAQGWNDFFDEIVGEQNDSC